ncbi:MAG: CehA/McbA family metallohydrolase [Kofleriaceae bacterium]
MIWRADRAVIRRALWLVLAALALVACDGDGPRAIARAQRVTASDQLIGGPKAVGRIGDYLLENDRIRVIIHDRGAGRVATLYGGSIVDADLVRPGGGGGLAGNDQLAEVLPAWLFEVINPTSVTVTADGADGGPAEITVRGVGGDLLQMVALLQTGLVFPSSLEFEQTYRLAPGNAYVEIESTITNITAGAHGLPYLDPSELGDLGLDIPGIEDLELSVPFGHLLLLGGEQAMFAPGDTGFNIRFGLEESYTLGGGFPAFPGLVVDHLASQGPGVSYGFAVPAGPSNYVNAFADRYGQAQAVTPNSLLVLFNYSSVAGAYSAQPPPVLQAGERFTYTSYFIVGRGDAASIYDVVQELRGGPRGTFAGRVRDARAQAPAAGTSVIVLEAEADLLVTQISPNERGEFAATLPPGDYRYQVIDDDRGPQPAVAFSIVADETTTVRTEVAPPARLAVFVLDERGRPAPAKLTLVGHFDPSHAGQRARDFLYDLPRGERKRPTSFEPDRTDFIEQLAYTDLGLGELEARPGSYELIVSRGPEYELVRRPVTLTAGTTTTLDVQLTRAFASDGWLAGDFHLHAAPSTDGALSVADRMHTAAGEGLEIAAATDHNYLTDPAPALASAGLLDWIHGLPGVELTTFEMGHFNAYPLQVDPGSTRGAEFAWTGQPPGALFEQLRTFGGGRDQTIVQVNHPVTSVLGYFKQFFLDPETGDTYTPTGLAGVFAPYGDEFQPERFSYDFDALEIINAKTLTAVHTLRAPDPLPPGPFPDPQPVPGEIVRGSDGHPSYPGAADTWFTLLDRGLRPTAMGTSDSHGVGLDGEPGYARTMVYVGDDRDEVGQFGHADLVTAIKRHKAIATNGPLIELHVGDAMIGDDVEAGPLVDVVVRVRAPSWAPVDRLVLWSNGGVALVDEPIPAAMATDYERTFSVTLSDDAWLVAEASGSANLFPVVTALEVEAINTDAVINALGVGFDLSGLTGALQPPKAFFVTPLAITNPIWVDVDGGGWSSPRPAIVP